MHCYLFYASITATINSLFPVFTRRHRLTTDNASYAMVLAPIVKSYRTKSYAFWLHYVSGDQITFEVSAADGTPCQVEIDAFWDDKRDGDIRVGLMIDDGGRDAFTPYCSDFIIAPDGSIVGE